MTLVHAPAIKHSCDIGWETVPWLPDAYPPPPPGFTHRAEMVHQNDPPGNVRQCQECGRCWVAVANRPGMAGVWWRPEGRLKRWMRERKAQRQVAVARRNRR